MSRLWEVRRVDQSIKDLAVKLNRLLTEANEADKRDIVSSSPKSGVNSKPLKAKRVISLKSVSCPQCGKKNRIPSGLKSGGKYQFLCDHCGYESIYLEDGTD